MQFYEIDLPHASTIKQKLVQKVLPDTNEVSQAVLLMPMLINHLLCLIAKAYGLQPHHLPARLCAEAKHTNS